MAEKLSNSSYIASFLFSLIAGFIVLTEDFAWWVENNSLGGTTDYYVWIQGENVPGWVPIYLIVTSLTFFFATYISFLGFRNPENMDKQKLDQAKLAIGLGLGLVIIGGIVFSIMAADAVNWDLGVGFYAGLVGGVSSYFFLNKESKNLN